MENQSTIPTQQTGGSSDTEATYKASSIEEAKAFFRKVKQRLLDVNHWKEVAIIPSAEFNVCDQFGRPVNRLVKEGDFFRITIPGPGNRQGDGDDWVRVECIEEIHEKDLDQISIKVRPSVNPQHPEETAHFFTEEATSSFIVERRSEIIKAAVHGRNETPNTELSSITDNIRNSVVATVAISFFSKIQWKALVNGLIKMQDE